MEVLGWLGGREGGETGTAPGGVFCCVEGEEGVREGEEEEEIAEEHGVEWRVVRS